jgi:replicative DNA helicase
MAKQNYVAEPLIPTTAVKAVKDAKEQILIERKGEQLGLKVRWESMNVANRKYFRFKNVYLIAGPSGHGKSYLLNEIVNDFMDSKGINKNFKGKVLVLYFCYEMSAVDEVLRTTASKTNVSYNKLLSSEWNRDNQDYDVLSDEELDETFKQMDLIANRPIFYFETAGNLEQLKATSAYYKKKYPDRKLVEVIDHTLLSEKLDEKDEGELMANTGKAALVLKKRDEAMVIILNQFNNNIEAYNRISDPNYHYPIKSDIYYIGQIYNACDDVMTIYQPGEVGISIYGRRKIPTKNVIHIQKIKARHGKLGSMWFLNALDKGNIIETSVDELKQKSLPVDDNPLP